MDNITTISAGSKQEKFVLHLIYGYMEIRKFHKSFSAIPGVILGKN